MYRADTTVASIVLSNTLQEGIFPSVSNITFSAKDGDTYMVLTTDPDDVFPYNAVLRHRCKQGQSWVGVCVHQEMQSIIVKLLQPHKWCTQVAECSMLIKVVDFFPSFFPFQVFMLKWRGRQLSDSRARLGLSSSVVQTTAASQLHLPADAFRRSEAASKKAAV